MNITLHVGRGERRDALTVFPLWQQAITGPPVRFADSSSVRVTENLGKATVDTLQVTTLAGEPVLLIDGDLLIGGRQDRVAIGSTLLAPGTTTALNVRCVERDRWSGTTQRSVGTSRATSFVRGNHNQHETWRRVAAEQHRAGRAPQVATLDILPGQCGVLIGISGRPTLLEVFTDAVLFAAAWPRIRDAAAREAAGRPNRPTTALSAREFIRLVDLMHPTSTRERGIGNTIAGAVGPLELRGVAHTRRLLHASIINHEGVAV